MSKITNANFISEKNKSANRPVFLYTIHDYDGVGSNLYFAEWDENVVYDSITYQKFPLTHDQVSENVLGEIDKMRVKIANVSREIQAYLEQYDWRGKKITLKMVFLDKLADTDAHIDDIFYIDSYTANQQDVEFILSSKLDVLEVALPTRKYLRNYCSWKFKSTECGYVGAETECNKTKVRCKALANYQRFGGFPSIPSRRIYVT